jgi:transposase
MQTITTIGFDIAKSVSRSTALTLAAKWSFVVNWSGVCPSVLSEAATMPGWHRSLGLVASLVARTLGTGSYRAIDAPDLRQALRQTAEERHGWRRNDLRGGHQSQHAVRANKDAGAAELPEMLHRTRNLFIRQQTAVINSIQAHLAEFGIVAPVGRKGVTELLDVVPTRTINGYPRWPARALLRSVLNYSASRSRF